MMEFILRVDEYFPSDPKDGTKAKGRFPVLLMQTPYGKAVALHNLADFFVRRGYILVIADLRGFGVSHGQAAFFGGRVGRDGAECRSKGIEAERWHVLLTRPSELRFQGTAALLD
jgi:predicted acyl esterase